MNQELFILPFLISFALAIILLNLFVMFGRRLSVFEKEKSSHHIHVGRISRFGGVAMIISFIVTVLLNPNLVVTRSFEGVLIGLVLILIFGVIDDVRQLDWKIQLFFQVFVVAVISFMGIRLEYISSPLGGVYFFDKGWPLVAGIVIVTAWMVLIMNSMNWVDGIDGVSGGITFIGILSVFILSLRPEVNQPPLGIISAAILGSLLAFLSLNFHPAKIFAGTSGSMFMGFILAILAIFAGAKIATTLLVLTVPVIDAFWVIAERFRTGNSIFSPDNRHLHHRLLQLGWTQRKICLAYWSVTAGIAAIALNTNATGKIFSFAFLALILLVFIIAIQAKLEKKSLIP